MFKTVMLDTNFLISYADNQEYLHQNAKQYMQYFKNNNIIRKTSIISIAEFNVVGDFNSILRKERDLCIPIGYDIIDAYRTSEFARFLFKAKKTGVVNIGHRSIIPNDTKIFATADIKSIDYFITADKDSENIYRALSQEFKLSFEFISLHNKCNDVFRELFNT